MKSKYFVLLKHEVRINIMYVFFVYAWHKIEDINTDAQFSKCIMKQIFMMKINMYGKIR